MPNDNEVTPSAIGQPKCKRCGWPLHRFRDLTLCDECEKLSATEASAIGHPWSWRRASGGVCPFPYNDLDLFHAYDVNDNAACEPCIGLVASRDEPNEGSRLCCTCADIARAEPWGREKRTYADAE